LRLAAGSRRGGRARLAASIALTIGLRLLPAGFTAAAAAGCSQCFSKSAASSGGTVMRPQIVPAASRTSNFVAAWLLPLDF